MIEIESEEIIHSEGEEEGKDSAPEVKKIKSYTDIMKMKLDK